MNTWRTTLLTLAGVAMLASLTPTAAHAYTGPGAGLTAIGSLLALVAALLLGLVGGRMLFSTPVAALSAEVADVTEPAD